MNRGISCNREDGGRGGSAACIVVVERRASWDLCGQRDDGGLAASGYCYGPVMAFSFFHFTSLDFTLHNNVFNNYDVVVRCTLLMSNWYFKYL